MPALIELASQLHDRLAVFTKTGCAPLLGVEPWPRQLNRAYTECEGYKAAALAEIKKLHPAYIVLTGAFEGFAYTFRGAKVMGGTWLSLNQWVPTRAVLSVWDGGLARTLADLKPTGAKLVVLGDIAYPRGDASQCVSAHQSDLAVCRSTPQLATFATHNQDEARTALANGASYVNTIPWFCTATTCDPVVGKIAVYRDAFHITRQYSLWLTRTLGSAVGLIK